MRSVCILSHSSTLHDSRRYRTADSLRRAGYRVTVVELVTEPTVERPLREAVDGIEIVRFSLTFLRRRAWGRWVRALEFFVRMTFIALRESDRNSVFHCYNIVTLLPGLLAGIVRRGVVYDAAELQTELPGLQHRQRLRWGIVAVERVLCRLAVLNIQADPLRAEFFATLHGVSQPLVINNTSSVVLDPRMDAKPGLLRTRLGLGFEKILLYVGGIRSQFYLETVIESLIELPEWHLVLLGHEIEPGYVDKLLLLSTSLGIQSRVHWHPGVVQEEVPGLVAGADLTVALMQGVGRSYRYCVPTKVYTSLAVGVPVIATHLDGLDRLFSQYRVGPQMQEVSSVTVVAAVHEAEANYQFFVDQCSKASREYRWAVDEERLLQAYERL